MMLSMPETQIKALIRLLSDENERIARAIAGKLTEVGDPAVPLLREAEIEQPAMAARISGILDDIRGQRLEGDFHALSACDDDDLDLEAGAFLIARFAYPDLEASTYGDVLDAMAREVRERLGRKASGEEIVKAINRYLFVEQGFAGNTQEYYDVENSYLNRVLERKTGIPISLGAVYLLVGKRLELPVFGVGMPGHFLVKYEADRYRIFVDCFNGGALLTQKDCARFLDQAGYGFDERYLQKTPSRAILIRMIKNLVAIYNKMDDVTKATRLTRFIEILGLPEKDE
ncbi:MAG TPA: transglutaminase-like domain-containing protein [Nitrospirales bacterium]|jgi:regulator of sirC expression with transglutaminase-like and TPR domain|nr:transglutaminase-like domain-containing protein [Nitrospirales bacterium]